MDKVTEDVAGKSQCRLSAELLERAADGDSRAKKLVHEEERERAERLNNYEPI